MKKKWCWLAEFKCGCTEVTDYKRDLLDYCGIHGEDRLRIFKILRLGLKKGMDKELYLI